MQALGTQCQQSQHEDVVQERESFVTTSEVLIRSCTEKIDISCISKLPCLLSSLKLYSLFFKPHPHPLDFFPACLLETAEPSLFLRSVSALLPKGSSLLSQELPPIIIPYPELTPWTCPAVVLRVSAKFHLNNVLFTWNSILLFPSVLLIEHITVGHTKHFEALDGFLLWFS